MLEHNIIIIELSNYSSTNTILYMTPFNKVEYIKINHGLGELMRVIIKDWKFMHNFQS